MLINQLDTNGDGRIDYGEFIGAAINRANLLSKKNLEIAFHMLDTDGNGFISVSELKAAFSGTDAPENDANLWTSIMEEVDQDNDSMISPEEFFNTMMSVLQKRSSLL